MKLFLNAGFGAPIGAETLKFIRDLGFAGVRQDINRPQQAAIFGGEILDAGLEMLAIVRDYETARRVAAEFPDKIMIELGNEQDSKEHPRSYARWAGQFYTAIREMDRDTPVITAGITTPDKKRLKWLEEVYAFGLPTGIHCGIHTYRGHMKPGNPHPGFGSRSAEYLAVRKICAGRPIHVTEIGWHTLPTSFNSGFLGLKRKTVQWTEDQIADFAREEIQIAKANGAESLTWFQLNDGPNAKDHESHYGIRRLDGSLKPVAAVFKEFA